LWRPSGSSAGVLLVLTLGTTVLLTTAFLGQSLLHQMSINEVYGSENLYLMNVPRDDSSAVVQFLARELGRAARLQPYAAFRLIKVNGHPVAGLDAARHRQSWFASSLEGMPPGTAALNPGAAALLNARIGDTVELLAQGQTKRLRIFRITPLPPVGVLHPDLMLSEDSFQDLRVAEGGAFFFDPARMAALEQRLQQRFPTIAMMNMADVIQTGRAIVAPLSSMIRFEAVFLLLAGLAILALSVAETATVRQREAAIFRVLGAKRQLIFSLYSLEFALIGLEAGIAGSSLAWLLCTYLSHYLFPDATLVNTLATAAAFTLTLAALTAGASWAACFLAVFEKPLVTLRRL
jgi:putative ABC transport system permease protein